MSSQCFFPCSADAGPGGFIFSAAGQIPGEPQDMLGPGARLLEKPDDPAQCVADLSRHVGRVFTLFISTGLARKHDPSAGRVDNDTVRKAAGLRPFGWLQDMHERSPGLLIAGTPEWEHRPG